MDYEPRSLWDPPVRSTVPRFAHLEPPAELAIDAETTGFGDDRRLVEIAVVKAKTGDVVLHQFFNPGVPSEPGALRVHGLSGSFLERYPRLSEADATAIQGLLAPAKPAKLIGHDVVFDLHSIDLELRRFGLELPDPQEIADTARLTKETFPDCAPPQYLPSLDTAARAVGLAPSRPQAAVEVALLCLAVYNELQRRAGPTATASGSTAPAQPHASQPTFRYYRVLWTTRPGHPRHERQYRNGVLEIRQPAGLSAHLRGLDGVQLLNADGTLLQAMRRNMRSDWRPGQELVCAKLPSGSPCLVEFCQPMSAEVFLSGTWRVQPRPAPQAVAVERRARSEPRSPIRPETANAVHAVRTIGRGHQPTRELTVSDLKRAIRTEYLLAGRLAEERDGYAGRCWQLERDNDMLRKRLAELSAVAELLQQ